MISTFSRAYFDSSEGKKISSLEKVEIPTALNLKNGNFHRCSSWRRETCSKWLVRFEKVKAM